MRTATAAEFLRLKGDANYHLAVEWLTSDGIWVNLSSLLGADWQVSADWGRDVDQPVMDANFEFVRGDNPSMSLSPLMGASLANRDAANNFKPLLKTGDRIRVHTAVTALGIAPVTADWKHVFEGYADEVDISGDETASITARDLGKRILDRFIEVEQDYTTEVAAEVRAQSLLDDNGLGDVVLYTKDSPGYQILPYTQQREPLYDALRALIVGTGYILGYRYDAADAFRFTLRHPLRGIPSAYDHTFDADDYTSVERLNWNDDGVGNVGYVIFIDENGVEQTYGPIERPASIADHGRKPIFLSGKLVQHIHTEAEAHVLINKVLDDVEDVYATHQYRCWYFWPADIGDAYRFMPNGVHYDSEQIIGVVGFRHRFENGEAFTTITGSGKLVGAHRTWTRGRGSLPGKRDPALDVTVQEVARDPDAGTITFRVEAAAAVEVVTVHHATIRQDHVGPLLPEDEEAEPQITILRADIDAGDDTFTLPIPTPGFITPVRVQGHRVDPLASGLAFEFVLDPAMEQPDRIVAWRVRVDNETGAVDVRMWGGPKLASVRWASVTGQTVVALPSDEAVEVGSVVDAVGGLVSFTLPPNTVPHGHEIIIRAAGYLYAGGTGRNGPTDHGDIITAAGERRRPPFSLEEGDAPYETTTHGIGSVRVLNEGGHPLDLYARGTADNVPDVWFKIATAPANGSIHAYAVELREKTKGGIDFELRGFVDGMPYTFPYNISGFDLGRIPDVTNALEFDDAGLAYVIHDGDVDTSFAYSWATPVATYPGDAVALGILRGSVPAVPGRAGKSGALGPGPAVPGEEWIAVTLAIGPTGLESSGLSKDYATFAKTRGPGGSVAVVYDEETGTASASLHGSAATTAWKVVASTSGPPTLTTVRATAPIAGSRLAPAQVGTLLSNVKAGDHIYLAALPLDVNGGEGPGLLTHEYVVGMVPATLVLTDIIDNTSPVSVTAVVQNPGGAPWALRVRERVGGAPYPTGWGSPIGTSATPPLKTDTAFVRNLTAIEAHPSQFLFLLTGTVNGVPYAVQVESPAMDLGLIANITALRVEVDQDTLEVRFSFKADSDTRETSSLLWKVWTGGAVPSFPAAQPTWSDYNGIAHGRTGVVNTGAVAWLDPTHRDEVTIIARAMRPGANIDDNLGPAVMAAQLVYKPPPPTPPPAGPLITDAFLQVQAGASNDTYTLGWNVNSAVTSSYDVVAQFYHEGTYKGTASFTATAGSGVFVAPGNGVATEWHHANLLLKVSGQTVHTLIVTSQSFL